MPQETNPVLLYVSWNIYQMAFLENFNPLNGDVSDSQLNARGGQNDHALKYI